MRPLVAVPAYPVAPGRVGGWDTAAVAVPETYLAALRRSGAQGAVVMPHEIDEAEAGDVLARFDGLLLIGGGDVDPRRYGQPPAEEVYGVDTRRDGFELTLVWAALAWSVPTLAICRGHQVLNVALGGSLEQHLVSGEVPHGAPGLGGRSTLHPVEVRDESRLASALGTTRAEVSSRHHQAVDKLGDGLDAVAWADDGVVEGIELDDSRRWVIGVQWHPEDTAAVDPVQQRLFDTFVRELTRY